MNKKVRYWILTIPQHHYVPFKPECVRYVRGQLEQGGTTGYLHWQLYVTFADPQRLAAVKRLFGDECHAEPTNSAAAKSYVWKDESAVMGTRFELGVEPKNRNSSKDWDAIRQSAMAGRMDEIPSDVYIRCYNSLRRISCDNAQPVGILRTVKVFWGPTGVGKSRRAWEEAGMSAYPKDPNTKFWDGYRDHGNVVIDEFRGRIDISHLLRWFDRYPVIVEIKGSSVVLSATNIWITSNLSPDEWYPDVDQLTRDALMRRLIIEEIN